MKRIAAAVLTLTFLLASPALADVWQQFRGPGGNGVSLERNLPTKWSSSKNVKFRTKLPGPGASSPIILGDRIYLTCYSGFGRETVSPGGMEDLMLHLVCCSAKTGKVIFNKKIKPTLPVSPRVRDHGYAAPTPTTDGQFLYVFFGKSGVFSFDLNGKQLWNTKVGSKTHRWGCGTSPVLYRDLVIVNASVESGSLVALNKRSGDRVWSAKGMKASWNTPNLVQTSDGKTEVVVSVRNRVLAFDPLNGNRLWTCEGVHDYVCPSIISQNGIVYVIGGRQSRAIAIRAGGRGDVTDSHTLWRAKAGANVCSPVIVGGHMYWVSDRNRVAYCLDLKDGKVVYSKRFRAQPYASAVAGDGKIYIVTRTEGTFVLAAKPSFTQLAHNELNDRSTFNASPAIANGKLFIRSNRYLYCIGK